MREIKFRAKCVGNEKWVEGDLVTLHYPKKRLCIAAEGTSQDWCNTRFYEVIPETVGQFTGLKDKHGKDMDWWEGDLIQEGENIKEIVYLDGCFWLQWVRHKEHKTALYVAQAWAETLNKVGTIHENPELLEGESQ
jgi:hypothetical protein